MKVFYAIFKSGIFTSQKRKKGCKIPLACSIKSVYQIPAAAGF